MPLSDSLPSDFLTMDAASPEETEAVASRLAPLLRSGDVLCLRGDLGAGKTTFTRGLVHALGSPALVSSPTFTLIHEYHGGTLPVFHFDAYRLRGPGELTDLGFDEYLDKGGVTVIEWPERIEEALPPERIDVYLEETGESDEQQQRRRIRILPRAARWADLPTRWKEAHGV
jgi:tRNA threonylcarbamoyladenosine biosynthesis protein TsaE